jgi:DNA modification methylase
MRNVNSPNPPARSAQPAWPDRSDSDRLATDRSAPGRLSPDRSDPGKAYTAHQTVEDVGGVRVAARLYVKSSELMDEVSPESITLTITSPPYWNAIDYDRHADDPTESYRTREYSSGFGNYESYLEWVSDVFARTLEKTRPGGYLAVVVGTVLFKGVAYPVPFDLVPRLKRAGWSFHQDIVWHKSTAGVKRAGVFIQHPYPGYYHPNIMTEYILIFKKPGDPIFRNVESELKDNARFKVGALFTKEIANNVWHIAPVPPRVIEHPCPFPEEIPYRLVQLYTYPGDTVLDPFLGSGQTTKVAFALGRNVVGYDVVERYVEYSWRRLREPLAVRSSQLVAEFKHIPLDAPLGYDGRSTSAKTRHGSGLATRSKPGEQCDGEM